MSTRSNIAIEDPKTKKVKVIYVILIIDENIVKCPSITLSK